MEERIGQMLSVIHAENMFILKTLANMFLKPDKAKIFKNDSIVVFEELFKKAVEGKLADDD